jgi:hypothetical protein
MIVITDNSCRRRRRRHGGTKARESTTGDRRSTGDSLNLAKCAAPLDANASRQVPKRAHRLPPDTTTQRDCDVAAAELSHPTDFRSCHHCL